MLLILTGKTAAGKDTVMFRLLSKFPNFQRVVTTTSRPPREGEQEGKDYYFISGTEFRNKINQGDFIEYVEYGGNLYGTPKSQINPKKNLVWRIDPSRAGQIRKLVKDIKIIVIYLTVADEVVLERLRKRGLTQEEIDTRMREDRNFWESFKDNYDFVIENIPGNLDATIDKIVSIIEKRTP